jgi:hypothetical protein
MPLHMSSSIVFHSPDADAAWAAALFDGEGSCGWRKTGAAMVILMSDKDLIDRFQAIVGVGTVWPDRRSKLKPHYKDLWRWTACAEADVFKVVEMIWPWLGERRREQVGKMIERFEQRRLSRELQCRDCDDCGESFDVPNPFNHSHFCAACSKERRRRQARNRYWRSKVF